MEHLPNLASYQDMLLGNLAGCHGSTALQDTSLESLGHALYDDTMVARETQWLSRRNLKKMHFREVNGTAKMAPKWLFRLFRGNNSYISRKPIR